MITRADLSAFKAELSLGQRQRQLRVLRNLKIAEVSSVDRGSGEGVRIVMTKRDGGEQKPIDPLKLWDCVTDFVAKRDSISKSASIMKCLSEPLYNELFQMAKMGGGGLPVHVTPTPNPETPFRESRTDVDGDADEGERLRAHKAQQRAYETRIVELMQQNPSTTYEQASIAAQKELYHKAAQEFHSVGRPGNPEYRYDGPVAAGR
jgi:hypothetical protein